jgi:hypothetical protein
MLLENQSEMYSVRNSTQMTRKIPICTDQIRLYPNFPYHPCAIF